MAVHAAVSRVSPAMDGTASRVLDTAEQLVQRRGFNGFSYADVAAALGVTKASLHYHFPTKAALGEALIARYAERFAESLRGIDATAGEPAAKLDRYAALYAGVLAEDRMCLCGMLAAEQETLPPEMRGEVLRFFESNERWLARVLSAGRRDGSLTFPGTARDQASLVIGTLEGAMLLARSVRDPVRFDVVVRRLLDLLRPRL